MNSERVLYTRYEHGNIPVTILGAGQARQYKAKGEEFRSFRSLMRSLNGGVDPKVGFDRYFGLGRHKTLIVPVVSPFIMFAATSMPLYIEVRKRGVDLSDKWKDVEKLFYSGFRGWLVNAGYSREDFEEVLQDVHMGLLSRNRGKGAWDPERSSFGHYVHLVCRSVITNHYNKRKRRLSRMTTGLKTLKDSVLVFGDAAEADHMLCTSADFEGVDSTLPLEDLKAWIEGSRESGRKDARVALEILPYVGMGMRRREISEESGFNPLTVGRALAFIRQASVEWQEA